MSDDNKNSESFDFDFNVFNEEDSQVKSENTFDLDNPFGDDLTPLHSNEANVSAESSHSDGFSGFGGDSSVSLGADSSVEESSEISEEGEIPLTAAVGEAPDKKKKGLLGGLFGGGKKDKAAKEKAPKDKKTKEKQPKPKKEKKEKAPKDKDASDKPRVPRDWGTVLCIAFSVFLLVSLLMFNVATFLTGGNSLMQTLCFLGAFNIVGLALVAVPILFYKFPQERTLPNVMLGVSVGAMFTGVLFLVNNFYQYYGFVIGP